MEAKNIFTNKNTKTRKADKQKGGKRYIDIGIMVTTDKL